MKISQMPAATQLDGGELVPIVQGGQNESATVEQIRGQQVQADIFNWTGSIVIPSLTWLNFATLAGILKAVDGGAGITIENAGFKFPAIPGWSFISLGTRVSGTISGGAGTARGWRIQQRRPDGITVVGSQESIKVEGVDISNRDNHLASYTNGEDDPFSVDGIQIGFYNSSAQTITLTSVSVRLQRITN